MNDTGKDTATEAPNPFMPSPDDMQHWASVMGRAQQLMLEYALGQANQGNSAAAGLFDPARWLQNPTTQAWAEQSSKMRSEEHTSELQSLLRTSYALFCLKKKK